MRIAVLQFAPWLGTLKFNLAAVIEGVRRAADAGAQILVAPEMSLTGWTLPDPGDRMALKFEVERVAVPALREAAVRWGVSVVVGGPVASNGGEGTDSGSARAANGVIAVGPDGALTLYRKMHLFGAERDWWEAGSAVAVFGVDDRRVGITICYDAEFPEIPRMTRLAGADLLLVPATNMTPYEDDQRVIFRARAIENEMSVVVANRVGREGDFSYFGQSLICDPRGRVLTEAGSHEDFLVADVPGSGGHDEQLSYLAHRRPEMYLPLAGFRFSQGVDAPSAVTRDQV